MTLLCGVLAYGLLASSVSGIEDDHDIYFALCSKPLPSPTPTPTVTPVPPVVDVRVEAGCSSFRGGSAQDPSGEYVCLRNHDRATVNLENWRLEDAGNHTYVFPRFWLAPGALVRVHSGPGLETTTDLYWGRGLVWNNDHDTVALYDHLGRAVCRYVY